MSLERENEELKRKCNDFNKLLEAQNEILKLTEKTLELEKRKNMYLMKRKYYDAELGDTVYVYDDDINNPEAYKKIGSTGNIRIRETEYNTCNQSGKIIYAKRCYNGELTETVCHHILDKFRNFFLRSYNLIRSDEYLKLFSSYQIQ